mmetsp:Transcript_96277/g.305464  ORF Transcript_96277/g.305464 Transcript_96277/m.305464 type:complete len:242 (+) Transcript_96277:218-943(+)
MYAPKRVFLCMRNLQPGVVHLRVSRSMLPSVAAMLSAAKMAFAALNRPSILWCFDQHWLQYHLESSLEMWPRQALSCFLQPWQSFRASQPAASSSLRRTLACSAASCCRCLSCSLRVLSKSSCGGILIPRTWKSRRAPRASSSGWTVTLRGFFAKSSGFPIVTTSILLTSSSSFLAMPAFRSPMLLPFRSTTLIPRCTSSSLSQSSSAGCIRTGMTGGRAVPCVMRNLPSISPAKRCTSGW